MGKPLRISQAKNWHTNQIRAKQYRFLSARLKIESFASQQVDQVQDQVSNPLEVADSSRWEW